MRKLLVPSVLTCALLAALVLAATAAAEVRVGEATAPVRPAVKPEADVIAAKAEYNSDTGAVTFKVTTVALPSPGTTVEPSELTMGVGLITTSLCGPSAINGLFYPVFAFNYEYAQPSLVRWEFRESPGVEPEFPETKGLAGLSTSGTTTTFTALAPKAVNRPFNCALTEVLNTNNNQQEGELLFFPLAVPPPTPVPAPAPAPAPASPPAPAAALSIAKLKPLKLKVGKWKTVRVKVTDTGGAATRTGSLRLKAPRGVLVKPEKQQLPVINAGQSWTVSAKVQLTAKAKKKSTVALTAAAGSATAKASLVLKRQG